MDQEVLEFVHTAEVEKCVGIEKGPEAVEVGRHASRKEGSGVRCARPDGCRVGNGVAGSRTGVSLQERGRAGCDREKGCCRSGGRVGCGMWKHSRDGAGRPGRKDGGPLGDVGCGMVDVGCRAS